jgi:peptidoglycan/LPS O-acetylase OafA/YrhL
MNDRSPLDTPQPAPRNHLADPSPRGTWIAGLILIVLGIAFLMQNMGTFSFPLRNWWALFILIPAFGALDTALRTYREAGNQLTAAARGSLLVGLVLTLVTASFLFELNWSYFGPALIILTGIGILFTAVTQKR